MKKLKEYPWIKILAAFVFTAIIVASILNALTPKSKEEISVPISETSRLNLNQSASTFSNIEFVGQDPSQEIDRELGVYGIENFSGSNQVDEIIQILSKQLGLTPDLETNVEDFLIGPDYSLAYTESENRLLLVKHLNQNMAAEDLSSLSSKRVNFDMALTQTQAFVNQLFPNHEFSANPSKAAFFEGEIHLNPTTESRANYVQIPFSQQLDSLPLVFDQQDHQPIEILIDHDLVITKATITPFQVSPTLISKEKLLTIDGVIERINNRSIGSIIAVSQEGVVSQPLDIEEIAGGLLKEVELEYRLDAGLRLVYPFYKFTGTLVNDEGQSFEVTLITPAIKVQL